MAVAMPQISGYSGNAARSIYLSLLVFMLPITFTNTVHLFMCVDLHLVKVVSKASTSHNGRVIISNRSLLTG